MNYEKYINSIMPDGMVNLMVYGMLFQWDNKWKYVGLFYEQQSWQLDI